MSKTDDLSAIQNLMAHTNPDITVDYVEKGVRRAAFLEKMAIFTRELEWLEGRFSYWGGIDHDNPDADPLAVGLAGEVLARLREYLEGDA